MFKYAISFIVVIGLAIMHAPALVHGVAYLENIRYVCSYADSMSECVDMADASTDLQNWFVETKKGLRILKGASQ